MQTETAFTPKVSATAKFVCDKCEKSFSCYSSLNKHLRDVHKIPQASITSSNFDIYPSKCFDCLVSFRQVGDLREHLKSFHNERHEVQEIIFDKAEHFAEWLSNLSATGKVQYIRERGKQKSSDGAICYFYMCNRSSIGKRGVKAKRERQLKHNGSCKLPYKCTSQIKVREIGGEIHIVYFETHYGHELEVQHLRLTKQQREELAVKLRAGVAESQILAEFRREDGPGRINLITKKDLHNIKMSYGIITKEESQEDCQLSGESMEVEAQESEIVNKINLEFTEIVERLNSVEDEGVLNQFYEYLKTTKVFLDRICAQEKKITENHNSFSVKSEKGNIEDHDYC